MIKYSFVIIAYNEEWGIRNTIEAIVEQDGLTNYEIIVVNDCSTDNTKQVVQKLAKNDESIVLINNPVNKGRGYSRAKGVEISRGEYIIFVDGDITLPNYWLNSVSKFVDDYDAVGGVAVPDGDVSYVFNRFSLKPKMVKHTAELTGSNFMAKRSVFNKIRINPNLKDGEDVDFAWRFKAAGFKAKSIGNLICEHNEHKSFATSLKWLYQSGIGASKLLRNYKKLRTPDYSFFAVMLVITSSVLLASLFNETKFLMLPVLAVYAVAIGHLMSKFEVTNVFNFFGASLTNFTLISSYMAGRLVGTVLNI